MTLSYDAIQQIVSREVDDAEEYSTVRLTRRKEAWDRYYGRKLGNETSGRSQFITRDTMDTIEWMLPYFIRTFASGDAKLTMKIKGQPAWVGQALMQKIHEDMDDVSPSIFLLEYQWFKDALVTDTAFVKPQWIRDIEKVDVEMTNISSENIQKMMNDPEVKIKKIVQEDNMFGPPVFTVDATVDRVIEDTIVADNVPYWEFLTSRDARDINDEHPKGQKTKVTIDYLKRIDRGYRKDKEPFFKGLDDIVDSIDSQTPDIGYPSQHSAGESHLGYDGEPADNVKFTSRNIQTVELIEWCTRIDTNEDGFLENVICWLVSGEKIKEKKLIRWEVNEEGFIPFCGLKPIIDCYKLYGISWADLIIEIQNLHTMLLRRILDNFDFQNSGRWIVDPEAGIDVDSLLNNAPGGMIIGKIDGITDVSPKGFMPGSFAILDYVKTIKESRTGLSDPTKGVPDPMNQTATGMQLIYSASMQRLELIARIFAETGIKDLYKKFGMLYQKYLKKPFMTEMFGDQRHVTPEMIRGKIVVTVNLGVAAQIGMQEAQKVQQVVGFLNGLNQQFPGLLNPQKIHNISRKYITSMGFRDVDEFINDLKSYTEEYAQQIQAQQQQRERMIALQQKMDEMELMLKGKDIETRAMTESTRIKSDDVADQRKFVVNKDRIEAQREKAYLDNSTDKEEAKLTAAVALRVKEMDKEISELDAAVDAAKAKLNAAVTLKTKAQKNGT